jgi:EmrB/QacA subfamily drug resistance transporter
MTSSIAETDPPSQPQRRTDNPKRLLYSLLPLTVLMPLSGWMFTVSLPVIRDDFGLAPDQASWIATAFSLPFMIFMPVYGRISEGLGKRRLLMTGILIFTAGSLLAFMSTDMIWLLVGRAIMGIGAASLLPLSLALIGEAFPSERRGWAMGIFSTIGPLTGVVGPLLAGFIVATWGWRPSFLPPAIFGVIGLMVVFWLIPAYGQPLRKRYLRSLDWTGVLLLTGMLTSLLFYFSSRPITGVPALQDLRLLTATIGFSVAFVWHENRRKDPFIRLSILRNRSLVVASLAATLRMMILSGGMGFVLPLFLADVIALGPDRSGLLLMLNPAAMAVVVRLGGQISDRWGSRNVVMAGFGLAGTMLYCLSQLPPEAPIWMLASLLFVFGAGAGLKLASLHRAALNDVHEEDLGTASGVYSTIRFLGSSSGAVFGGILIQYYLNDSGLTISAVYQNVFTWYAGFALLGLLLSAALPNSSSARAAS